MQSVEGDGILQRPALAAVATRSCDYWWGSSGEVVMASTGIYRRSHTLNRAMWLPEDLHLWVMFSSCFLRAPKWWWILSPCVSVCVRWC